MFLKIWNIYFEMQIFQTSFSGVLEKREQKNVQKVENKRINSNV